MFSIIITNCFKDDLRRHKTDQKHREVQWVEQHQHCLVPAKYHEYTEHPRWYLCDAADGAALRLDIISICIPTEFVGEIDDLGLGEDDEGGFEIEVVFR